MSCFKGVLWLRCCEKGCCCFKQQSSRLHQSLMNIADMLLTCLMTPACSPERHAAFSDRCELSIHQNASHDRALLAVTSCREQCRAMHEMLQGSCCASASLCWLALAVHVCAQCCLHHRHALHYSKANLSQHCLGWCGLSQRSPDNPQ